MGVPGRVFLDVGGQDYHNYRIFKLSFREQQCYALWPNPQDRMYNPNRMLSPQIMGVPDRVLLDVGEQD